MSNRDLDAAWTYHNATKHSSRSVRSSTHYLDWANQPLPFKIYRTLPPLPLPGETRASGVAALSAISEAPVVSLGTSRKLLILCRRTLGSSLVQWTPTPVGPGALREKPRYRT